MEIYVNIVFRNWIKCTDWRVYLSTLKWKLKEIYKM